VRFGWELPIVQNVNLSRSRLSFVMKHVCSNCEKQCTCALGVQSKALAFRLMAQVTEAFARPPARSLAALASFNSRP
jgi:hypothetical protein